MIVANRIVEVRRDVSTMAKSNRNISIKGITAIIFVFSMMLSISGIGYLIFSGWLSSARQQTGSMSDDINESIYNRVHSYMQTAEKINEVNYRFIQNNVVDLSENAVREKFFAGVLSAQSEEVYSFTYGTSSGEYYGARRNESGAIEIMQNNEATGGASWYYSVKEDLTADQLVLRAGRFDPRTREWYTAAQTHKGPVFSPVYKHFVMDDLAISAAWPIFGSESELLGVMGTHLLLSDIGTYLEGIVDDYNGYAIVVERNTGEMIANSMEIDNFNVLADGTLKRYDIGEIRDPDIEKAYLSYGENLEPSFIFESENGNLFVDARELSMGGLEWIVVSAVPEALYMADVVRTLVITALLTALALMLSIVVYNAITGYFLRPMNEMLQVSAALANGDLSERVKVARNDEFGKISASLNHVADKMQFLINNLEANVEERTREVSIAYEALGENKDDLQLILNSAAEGIYGIDLNGNCTFCNSSCMSILGYHSLEDLLGQNMHWQIHHHTKKGRRYPLEECKIFRSMKQGKGLDADDEVFWRGDGTSFAVEYHSYPKIKDGTVIGAVITFMDITDRKKREDEIKFFSCHDVLTGLQNRRCFEEDLLKIDIPENLPLAVIVADINGLKMTNDIFGHAAGDELIILSAEVLKNALRQGDLLSRIGGDEFTLLLPKTSREEAEKVIAEIQTGLLNVRVSAIKGSISLGLDIKYHEGQSLEEVMANAENAMYRNKTINRKSTDSVIMENIVASMHSRSPEEKRHAEAVRDLCASFGTALQLSETKIGRLKLAGYLHDIGKITLDQDFLSEAALSDAEHKKMQQHPGVAYRLLSLFDDTLDIADHVYSHHEWWDGSGYPRGLKGAQINVIARIIAIAETYDRVLHQGDQPVEVRKEAAIQAIRGNAGTRFDPMLAQSFVEMVSCDTRQDQ